ncbi:MAG: FAD-binding protein, partial [Phaeodactylibacter sp.]|nr:FAD-binding protein [Phaeodactylibacter sp.]
MKIDWHETYDVVVVGTGASGLTAAVTAEYNGLKTLVLEKLDKWGGSSAYSGGGLWIPDNFLMQEAGALDSPEEALEYMQAVIEEVGPASSRARKEAYVKQAPKMVLFLKNLGFEWQRADMYPDYYPNVKGGKTGRVIESTLFNGKKLKGFLKTQIAPPGMPPIAIASGDAYLLALVMRTWKGFRRVMGIAGKTIGWMLTGRYPLGIGRALTGRLMYILQSNYQTPVWLKAPLKDLILEEGRVATLVVEKEGQKLNIKANKGVLLGAGGFPKNPEYRKKYQPVDGSWSSAAPGNTGDAIQLGEQAGDDARVLSALQNLGVVFHERGEWIAALDAYKEALGLAEALDQPGRVVQLAGNLGNLWRYLGELDAARDVLQRGLERARADGNRYMEAVILNLLADVASDGESWATAERLWLDAIAVTVEASCATEEGEARL